MTWVKVCGLTREDDVVAACDAGADAVGLVLVPSSPRAVTPERAARLAAVATCPAVLLTLDVAVETARRLVADTGAAGIQPYGRHAGEVATALAADGVLVLLPLRPEEQPPPRLADGVVPLFDAPPGGVLGGSGERFDWDLLRGYEGDFVVAGGLGPHNVAAAIRDLQPWGVDASSWLEVAPGIKDHSRVAAFIEEARSA